MLNAWCLGPLENHYVVLLSPCCLPHCVAYCRPMNAPEVAPWSLKEIIQTKRPSRSRPSCGHRKTALSKELDKRHHNYLELPTQRIIEFLNGRITQAFKSPYRTVGGSRVNIHVNIGLVCFLTTIIQLYNYHNTGSYHYYYSTAFLFRYYSNTILAVFSVTTLILSNTILRQPEYTTTII